MRRKRGCLAPLVSSSSLAGMRALVTPMAPLLRMMNHRQLPRAFSATTTQLKKKRSDGGVWNGKVLSCDPKEPSIGIVEAENYHNSTSSPTNVRVFTALPGERITFEKMHKSDGKLIQVKMFLRENYSNCNN